MNAKNAQYIGRQDGREVQRKVEVPFTSKEDYSAHGAMVAGQYRAPIKTEALYIQGWNEAWVEPVVEAPIPHNPNTRFCSCSACMAAPVAEVQPEEQAVFPFATYLSSQVQQHEEGSFAGGVFHRISNLYAMADSIEAFADSLQESIEKLQGGYLLDPQLRLDAIALYQQVMDMVGILAWKALQAVPEYCTVQAAKFVAEPEAISLAAFMVA